MTRGLSRLGKIIGVKFNVTVHGVLCYEHEREMLRKNRDWHLFCPLKRVPVPAFSLKRPAIFYEEPP